MCDYNNKRCMCLFFQTRAGLGAEDEEPLPAGWATGVAPNGRIFYIDHNTAKTTWVRFFEKNIFFYKILTWIEKYPL